MRYTAVLATLLFFSVPRSAIAEQDALQTLRMLSEIQQENLSAIVSYEVLVVETFCAPTLREEKEAEYRLVTQHTELTLPHQKMTNIKRVRNVRILQDEQEVVNETHEDFLHRNPLYIFSYANSNPAAFLYEIDARGNVHEDALKRVRLCDPRNLLAYGFGDGKATLSEAVKILATQMPDDMTLSVDSVDDNEGLYTFSLRKLGTHLQSITIDAARGSLTRKVEFFDESGKLLKLIEVEADVFLDGRIWFPISWNDTSYVNAIDGSSSIATKTTNRVKQVNFNLPEARRLCSVQYLVPQENLVVYRSSPQGSLSVEEVSDILPYEAEP